MEPPTTAEKILSSLKGLHRQMRADEQPLFTTPAIWENNAEDVSTACDLVLTNQRIFGYLFITIPRERLFLDALELTRLKAVIVRQKSFELVFRGLFLSDGQKHIYIRAPRKKVEQTYQVLRQALAEYAPNTHLVLEGNGKTYRAGPDGVEVTHRERVYGRQQVRRPLERSPLGIALLLTGGLLLEIGGALVWAATGSAQTGGPLLMAGLVAVACAFLARRQLR
jgi:hypothetical protein